MRVKDVVRGERGGNVKKKRHYVFVFIYRVRNPVTRDKRNRKQKHRVQSHRALAVTLFSCSWPDASKPPCSLPLTTMAGLKRSAETQLTKDNADDDEDVMVNSFVVS